MGLMNQSMWMIPLKSDISEENVVSTKIDDERI